MKNVTQNHVTTSTDNANKAQGQRPLNQGARGQRGASLESFVFWLILSAIVLLAIMTTYTSANSNMTKNGVVKDVVAIRSAVEDWRGQRTNLTAVSIDKLCEDGFGNKNAPWCGASQDGKSANGYGGDYSVKVNSNVSRVDITITNIDPEYVKTLGNALAPLSSDRCASIDGCATLNEADTTITVTM